MSPADGGSDARKRTNPPVACLFHFHMLFLQTLAGGMHQMCWWEPTLRPVSSFIYFFFQPFFLLLLLCSGLSSIPQDFIASNCSSMKIGFVGKNPFKKSFLKKGLNCAIQERLFPQNSELLITNSRAEVLLTPLPITRLPFDQSTHPRAL